MRWIKIDKDKCTQPSTGMYSDWKPILADEAHHQCVYCAIPEARLGGIRNFHVEHYRPKSKEEFAALENVIRNLFYSCPICNTFKGDDWPCEPNVEMSIPCYLDPGMVDYNAVFHLQQNAEVVGVNISAKYMVEKLFLNRPHLILERRYVLAQARLSVVKGKLEEDFYKLNQSLRSHANPAATQLTLEYMNKLNEVVSLFQELSRVIPYRAEDVSRQ